MLYAYPDDGQRQIPSCDPVLDPRHPRPPPGGYALALLPGARCPGQLYGAWHPDWQQPWRSWTRSRVQYWPATGIWSYPHLQWVMHEYDESLQLTTLVTACTTMRMRGPVAIARPCSPSPTVPLRLFSPRELSHHRPGVPHVRNTLTFHLPPAMVPAILHCPQSIRRQSACHSNYRLIRRGSVPICPRALPPFWTRWLRRTGGWRSPAPWSDRARCGMWDRGRDRGIAEAVAPDGLALGLDIHAGCSRRRVGRMAVCLAWRLPWGCL